MENLRIKEKSPHPKFHQLPDEFVHNGVCWVSWSELNKIKYVEKDMKFHPDDVLLATYPKSGTTLIQEIAWLILNNVNIEKAKASNIIERCPFIEENYEHMFHDLNYHGFILDVVDRIPRPRFLKTHLLFRNLENQMNKVPEMKVLTILRNPKDAAVSMYHFYKGVPDYGPFEGTWDEFFERWYEGWIGGGDWLDVTVEWWNQRHRDNLKIVFYEDLIYNRYEVIKEVSKFLNKSLSDDQINEIVEHTQFKKMKENEATNYLHIEGFCAGFNFMRKGEVGDWKNWFSKEQSRLLDEKYNPILEKVGLKFRYE